MSRLKSSLWCLNAWVLGVLEVWFLVLATIWVLMQPAVFERYYPIVREPSRVGDAAVIVRWICGAENFMGLNSGLHSGQLNRKELHHYADVRRWMRRVPVAMLAFGCAATLLMVISSRRRLLFLNAQWRGLVFLTVVLGFGLLLAVWDWKVFFAWIHYPLFGATSWKFSRSAYSLQLFPNEFWQWMGIAVVLGPAMVMAGMAGLIQRGKLLQGVRSPEKRIDSFSEDASTATGQ